MVGEGVVYAAAVDVEVLAEVLYAYAGALYVPAGVADAPGGIPLEGLVLELALRKPEDEVVLVALIGVLLHALAHADVEVVRVEVVENIVALELGGVEVDVPAREVGVAGVHELRDNLDVLVDAVVAGSTTSGVLMFSLAQSGEEGVGVELRYLHDGLVLALRALEHLILAGVGVELRWPTSVMFMTRVRP